MARLCDGTSCALRFAQGLERSETESPANVARAVRAAELCAAASQCPDSAMCVVACAEQLDRLIGR